MSCSNWVSNSIQCRPNNGREEMSPQRHDNYQLDGVALQLGLGLPVELIGVASSSNSFDWTIEDRIRIVPHREKVHNHKVDANGIKKTLDGIPIRKVYVTNISLKVEREHIFEIFSRFGRIMNVNLKVTKTARKQFAFVTFVNPKAASRALTEHVLIDPVGGGKIFVEAADSWHQPTEGPGGRLIWSKTRAKEEENSEEDEELFCAVDTELATAEINEESLNILNDDCLLHIFSFLPLQEVARCERVCKRWQALSYRTWRCIHKLSFREKTLPNMKAQTYFLSAYLYRCGPSLIELDLRVSKHKFDETTLAIVAKHCKKLEVLQIEGVEVGKRSLAHLGHNCPNLKQLVMEGCEKFGDKDLMMLLSKCPQLTLLTISENGNITGKFLSNVSSSLTSLCLTNIASLKINVIIDELNRVSKSLQMLKIHLWTNLLSEQVQKLVSAVPNLTSLALSQNISNSTQLDDRSLEMLGQLKQLTSLNLNHYCGLNDSALTAIVDGCTNLLTINLSSSAGSFTSGLTSEGLGQLGKLKKLKHVDISYSDVVTDITLKNLSSRNNKIQNLVCRGCPAVTDEGCVQVVTLCYELQLFDLSGCNNVSNDTVSAAITFVKTRTNNVPLELVVGGTNVTDDFPLDLEVPLLTIQMKDLSEEYLRPGYIDDMFFPPSDSDEEEDLDHLCMNYLCCDCDFEYDDLYDPVLWAQIDSTTIYNDSDLSSGEQWTDNSEDDNEERNDWN